jgi:hypothetical protein
LISSGGQQVVDTNQEHVGIIGPAPAPTQLAPGDSAPISTEDTPVIWDGPLDITPMCMGTAMPPITLAVANPGALPQPVSALQQALADTGNAFENCTPTVDGSWVTGQTGGDPTGGQTTATLDARCAALVQMHDGFDVVVLAIVWPPHAPDIDLAKLPGAIQAVPKLDLPDGTTMAMAWWVYVVTRDGTNKVQRQSVALCPNSSSSGSGVVAACST